MTFARSAALDAIAARFNDGAHDQGGYPVYAGSPVHLANAALDALVNDDAVREALVATIDAAAALWREDENDGRHFQDVLLDAVLDALRGSE